MPTTARYAALARLLIRHGRSDLVSGAGLDEFGVDELAGEEGADPGTADRAERLAEDIEAMGPT